jgi:ATP-dependent DNA helicase PIF1
MNNVIDANIFKGKYKGEDVLITRIPFIPNDMPIDFTLNGCKFQCGFAMSINKLKGSR